LRDQLDISQKKYAIIHVETFMAPLWCGHQVAINSLVIPKGGPRCNEITKIITNTQSL
jgi:hypothetical protein